MPGQPPKHGVSVTDACIKLGRCGSSGNAARAGTGRNVAAGQRRADQGTSQGPHRGNGLRNDVGRTS